MVVVLSFTGGFIGGSFAYLLEAHSRRVRLGDIQTKETDEHRTGEGPVAGDRPGGE